MELERAAIDSLVLLGLGGATGIVLVLALVLIGNLFFQNKDIRFLCNFDQEGVKADEALKSVEKLFNIATSRIFKTMSEINGYKIYSKISIPKNISNIIADSINQSKYYLISNKSGKVTNVLLLLKYNMSFVLVSFDVHIRNSKTESVVELVYKDTRYLNRAHQLNAIKETNIMNANNMPLVFNNPTVTNMKVDVLTINENKVAFSLEIPDLHGINVNESKIVDCKLYLNPKTFEEMSLDSIKGTKNKDISVVSGEVYYDYV